MAIISIYISDSGAIRAYDAIANNYRYPTTVINPLAGQNITYWSPSSGENSTLLPIASGVGYVGDLPTYGFSVPPFVDGDSGIMGVITGVQPNTISNPISKESFTNSVLRNFVSEHVRSYELELARRQAEEALAGNIMVDDGATAAVYNYHMVCVAPAKAQYDYLASIIAPGNTFDVALSADGNAPATCYALEAGITETARQQLLVLELAGGTTTDGNQTLFYVRCDPDTGIAQATNVDGYAIVGETCSLSALIAYMGLQIIGS